MKSPIKQAFIVLSLFLSSIIYAQTCPFVDDSTMAPEGWTVVAMSQLVYPGEFVSARYITAFGLMSGLMICDYTDQYGMPFYLMSECYYPDPNPHEDKSSDWIPKHTPFNHLYCVASQDRCQF